MLHLRRHGLLAGPRRPCLQPLPSQAEWMGLLDGVTVSYGSVTAVRDVSLRVGAGDVMALLGPNGAGKSSILKGIAGTARAAGSRFRFSGSAMTYRAQKSTIRAAIAAVNQIGRRFDFM